MEEKSDSVPVEVPALIAFEAKVNMSDLIPEPHEHTALEQAMNELRNETTGRAIPLSTLRQRIKEKKAITFLGASFFTVIIIVGVVCLILVLVLVHLYNKWRKR